MNIESFREYCLKKKGSEETYPFDETTLVFKVMNKMFALTDLESIPLWINLKCDPEKAMELRERYESVQPGYHMNKKYWNTIILDNTIPDREVYSWIDDSYNLIVESLKKKDRELLDKM
ncbi:MAG: MmcQ/YjbR family DNA-binding protein [Ignavibacteriales bacterium]